MRLFCFENPFLKRFKFTGCQSVHALFVLCHAGPLTQVNKARSCHGVYGPVDKKDIGLSKMFLWFLSQNTHFSFLPRTFLNNVFTVLSTTCCHFSGNFIIPSSPKFFIFFSKELFEVSFIVFQGNEIFFTKSILKTKINANPNVQYQVNMADESDLPSQSVAIFALSSKK